MRHRAHNPLKFCTQISVAAYELIECRLGASVRPFRRRGRGTRISKAVSMHRPTLLHYSDLSLDSLKHVRLSYVQRIPAPFAEGIKNAAREFDEVRNASLQ
jgi:hypothetical protein